MMMSRGTRKPSISSTRRSSTSKQQKVPSLQDFISKRDFTGALALLEFQRRNGGDENESDEVQTLMWIGFCAFHLGKYERAQEVYTDLMSGDYGKCPEEVPLYLACVYYYMQMYPEAQEAANEVAKDSSLKNRVLFHVCHKLGDEHKLMVYHQKLTDTNEDQLSLAAIHYLRGHFQEATDIYKRLLLENREDLALNAYVAMCYYKLDYYDVSLEILLVYLNAYPDSAVAINLKACNHFRLYNGKAAEAELKVLKEHGHVLQANDLIRHNMVVFSGGDQALQVLPSLVDFIPEARLNLVIYYLRNDSVEEADNLLKDLEPSTPQEYILKGVVNACMGQSMGMKENLKKAQQFFQLVGASASECDTIPGRQCMASCFFLLRQFEDVNIYLNSIKQYMYADDDFNWNYGISLAATGSFKKAEEALLLVQNENYKAEYCYISWLARCYIMNSNPRNAWELYLKMDTSNESFNLLQLIANDCYRMGSFLYAAKAFDVLERLDPDPEYWEGKRGAFAGVFQAVVAGKAPKEDLRDVLAMVKHTGNPQVEYITRVIRKWAKEANVKIN
mmetsp:Transcript_18052/g.36730  ORF Transcript_18052/g.36730 Transcript_18052/m.36730 type:complete len:561 (+) Transcript_18052:90-1772(+)